MNPKFALAKLGIAYSISQEYIDKNGIDVNEHLSREKLISESMPLVKIDTKAMSLLYTWITNYAYLLKEADLIKEFSVPDLNKAIISGLLVKANLEKQFSNFIQDTVPIKKEENKIFNFSFNLHSQLGHFPYDSSMDRFGIKITELALADAKKLRAKEWIEKQ